MYLRFVDKAKSQLRNYISIVKIGDNCHSLGVGMSPDLDGRHEVSIGQGCAFTGIVIHELMHAIGKTMSTQKGNIVI